MFDPNNSLQSIVLTIDVHIKPIYGMPVLVCGVVHANMAVTKTKSEKYLNSAIAALPRVFLINTRRCLHLNSEDGLSGIHSSRHKNYMIFHIRRFTKHLAFVREYMLDMWII